MKVLFELKIYTPSVQNIHIIVSAEVISLAFSVKKASSVRNAHYECIYKLNIYIYIRAETTQAEYICRTYIHTRGLSSRKRSTSSIEIRLYYRIPEENEVLVTATRSVVKRIKQFVTKLHTQASLSRRLIYPKALYACTYISYIRKFLPDTRKDIKNSRTLLLHVLSSALQVINFQCLNWQWDM